MGAALLLYPWIMLYDSGMEPRAFITCLDRHTDAVNAVAISPDGSHVISGSNDKTLQFWDAITGIAIVSRKHSGSVTTVAVSVDGNRIVSGSEDATLQAWQGQDCLEGYNYH